MDSWKNRLEDPHSFPEGYLLPQKETWEKLQKRLQPVPVFHRKRWVIALAACVALLLIGPWASPPKNAKPKFGQNSPKKAPSLSIPIERDFSAENSSGLGSVGPGERIKARGRQSRERIQDPLQQRAPHRAQMEEESSLVQRQIVLETPAFIKIPILTGSSIAQPEKKMAVIHINELDHPVPNLFAASQGNLSNKALALELPRALTLPGSQAPPAYDGLLQFKISTKN